MINIFLTRTTDGILTHAPLQKYDYDMQRRG